MLERVGFPSFFVEQTMVCVRTLTLALMINDSLTGFFKSTKGLRQGDTMSPLPFALGMDYLDRMLSYVGEIDGFKFHVRCKELKLIHLCFADDLLLFCNGDLRSIYILLQAFQMFSNASGLEVNRSKFEIYFAGMSDNEVTRVTDVIGFSCGILPFN